MQVDLGEELICQMFIWNRNSEVDHLSEEKHFLTIDKASLQTGFVLGAVKNQFGQNGMDHFTPQSG